MASMHFLKSSNTLLFREVAWQTLNLKNNHSLLITSGSTEFSRRDFVQIRTILLTLAVDVAP